MRLSEEQNHRDEKVNLFLMPVNGDREGLSMVLFVNIAEMNHECNENQEIKLACTRFGPSPI